MPAAVIVQASLPYDSNLPQDVSNNTFYFTGQGDAQDVGTIAVNLLGAFYGEIESWLSNYLANRVDFKVYNAADPQPRTPVILDSLPITPGSFPSLPEEVALCLSYHGEYVSGEPPSRYRGRIYTGPFAAGALDTSDNVSRPAGALVTALAGAGQTLMEASDADCTWAMYSETRGAFSTIVGGWVDNAWDTQRRRGHAPSARTVWP